MAEYPDLNDVPKRLYSEFSPEAIETSPRAVPEIPVMLMALGEIVDDLEKHIAVLRERIRPILNDSKNTPTAPTDDKRGCGTEIGQSLATLLDRLQAIRDHVGRTTNLVEL